MKLLNKITPIIVISLFFVSVIGCVNEEKPDSEESNETAKIEVAPENLLAVDYAVNGMVCAMGCAKTIQDEVATISGVAACNVDFEEGKAHIEYDKSQLSEKDIIAKIEGIADGQYKVSEWKEKENTDTEEDVENETEEGNGEEEETIESVKLPTFEIPNLFTLLIDQL